MGQYTDQDWYHIAHMPDGAIHVYRLDPDRLRARAALRQQFQPDLPDDEAEALAVGDYDMAICAILGMTDEWRQTPQSTMISPGEPHPSLMARATVHDDLPEVN